MFSDMAIFRIITNTFYVGKVRHKEKKYDGQHEPIVSPELFESV